MRVQVAGMGKVGRAFALLLKGRGFEVLTYEVRSGRGELEDADILFVATRDDFVPSTARRIYESGRRYGAVGHFSGALTSDVLKPFPERFSFHPLQAFNRPDPHLWEGITVTFEGTEGARRLIEALVSRLPVRMVEIPPDRKPLYHAAAVLVSNLIYAPLTAGEEIFASLGLSREDYARLVEVSFRNFLSRGLEGLTGPIVRGDEGTLRKHLEALKDREDVRELYEVLTRFLKRRVRGS